MNFINDIGFIFFTDSIFWFRNQFTLSVLSVESGSYHADLFLLDTCGLCLPLRLRQAVIVNSLKDFTNNAFLISFAFALFYCFP